MRIRKTLWNNDAEPIMVIMAILVVLGTINVFSSSYVLATIDYENPYYFLTRHLIWLVVGVAAFVGCRHINYRRWRIVMPWLLLGMFAALALVLVIGTSINGARRWLSIGGFGFQPAEFAKLLSLMLAACGEQPSPAASSEPPSAPAPSASNAADSGVPENGSYDEWYKYFFGENRKG